jgi:hypothetical protein
MASFGPPDATNGSNEELVTGAALIAAAPV